MMYGGKRATSQHIVYDALNMVQAKTQEDPLKLFKRAVDNVKPSLEVKSRRVGGSNYQVPVEVNPRAARRSRCAGSSASRASARSGRWWRSSPTSSWTRPTCAAAP
jgi:small subunit ribosomal protein S7